MPKPRKNTRKPSGLKAKMKVGKAGKPRRQAQPTLSHDIDLAPAAQVRAAHPRPGPGPGDAHGDAQAAVLDRLWDIVESRKGGSPDASHSARLIEKGTARIVQKLGEEAVECLIEAMAGNRTALIGESADLLYHLLVTWVDAGIRPEEVWGELERREGVSRMAGETNAPLKRLLGSVNVGTTKIP